MTTGTDTLEVPEKDGGSAATSPDATAAPWWRSLEVLVALAGFLGLVVVALTHATSFLEPDDYAYRASIVALSEGHILLSAGQYDALVRQLSTMHPSGIAQWHHLASGKWISEKNPGYPFFAVAFYLAHALRLAPLFYGGLAAVGLYHGARAWAGRWAGTCAVWLYCASGAALVFAWRATMPSFTDASLIAAGTGGLLWTMLSVEASPRRRAVTGLLSFLALDGAVFIRYTDVATLLVALVAVLLVHKAAKVHRSTLALWLGTNALFAIGLALFNHWAYGGASSTGYSAGEITFSLSAIVPNLKIMPRDLAITMPAWLIATVALIWILSRWARPRDDARAEARRDAVVGAALALAWLSTWLWYLAYTWTAQMGGGGSGDPVHVIRFYLPALGPLALLAAWAVVRWRPLIQVALVSLLVLIALASFHTMAASGPAGAFGPGHGQPAFGPGGYGGSGGPFARVPRPSGVTRRGGPPTLIGPPPSGTASNG